MISSRKFQLTISAQDIILLKNGRPATNTLGSLVLNTEISGLKLGEEVEAKKAIREMFEDLLKHEDFSKLWEEKEY